MSDLGECFYAWVECFMRRVSSDMRPIIAVYINNVDSKMDAKSNVQNTG